MSTPITVGKARLIPVLVTASGSPDTTTVVSAQSGNATTLKVRMNPSDNRQCGVLGVAPSSGVNATVTIAGHSAAELFVVSAAASAPPADAIAIGSIGPEIDPPDWLTA